MKVDPKVKEIINEITNQAKLIKHAGKQYDDFVEMFGKESKTDPDCARTLATWSEYLRLNQRAFKWYFKFYNGGYETGFKEGKKKGYNLGYQAGFADAGDPMRDKVYDV